MSRAAAGSGDGPGTLQRGALEKLLGSYPRQRPPLPPAQRAIYLAEYKANRTGQNPIQRLAQAAESWMHRQVARHPGGERLLEIGAGALNHLPYESAPTYDIVEPFTALYEDSPQRARVARCYADIGELAAEPSYDRILSIAVLEHLEDLPTVIARSGRLLRSGGRFQAGIPSEGGFLWGLGWRCTTGLSYRLRTGLSYGMVMRHEHLSQAPEIVAVVRYFFERVELRYFPLPHHHLSLYAYLEASHPIVERCDAQLEARAHE